MMRKRAFLTAMGGLACVAVARPSLAQLQMPMARHETFMRMAIEEGRKNPAWPFGAVMVDPMTGDVVARGVNDSRTNPMLHGEVACMNDYMKRHGNSGWSTLLLYTTGEPCPMCMSALVWAGIGGVVFGSSIDAIARAGIGQIGIHARAVIDASPFYKGTLVGGMLEAETDQLFLQRRRN